MKYQLYRSCLILLFAGIGGLYQVQAQAPSINPADQQRLEKMEDTLKDLSFRVVFGVTARERFHANDSMVRKLVQALKIRNSFYYPFDSLNLSKLYAPDSSFRLFTWQLKKDEYVYHQMGAIQMNTPDGSLKLYPLHDVSMFTGNPLDSVRSRNNWIGAIYYKIILKKYNGRNYYTLLGFDDYSPYANKKWMEVLTFNDRGEPVFGGPYISFKEDSVDRRVQDRFDIEYKKDAQTSFNYDPNLDLIVFDHLISETEQPEKKSTYIPDGSFEAFKWENGQWVHKYKVFDYKLQDGQFPQDATILDKSGNVDEKKLEEASRRNLEKAGGSNTPENKKKPVKKKDNRSSDQPPLPYEDKTKLDQYF